MKFRDNSNPLTYWIMELSKQETGFANLGASLLLRSDSGASRVLNQNQNELLHLVTELATRSAMYSSGAL